MKVVVKAGETIVLVSEQGEEVLGALTDFCREREINGATFTALGAVKDTTLAYYDLEAKEYHTRELVDIHELGSCTGNVGLKPAGEVFVHAHGVLGDSEMNTKGGHIVQMTTAVTCEITLQVLPEVLQRESDEFSGLDLLS